MRTIILSDLHLGNGGPYDIFAGAEALPALLSSLPGRTRVVLNGDTFDFLLNADPLDLTVEQAVAHADALVRHAPTRRVLEQLGRILAGDGEVIVVSGNHDLEVCLRQVQSIIRGALGQDDAVAARLRFHPGNEPLLIEVAGARVLVAHGENNDRANRFDYQALLSRLVDPSRPFHYPPGSLLVKELLNPLKVQFGLRFMDLLKPDFQGAALTALATHPEAMRVLLNPATLAIVGGILTNRIRPMSFGADGLASSGELLVPGLMEAGLSDEEARALWAELSPPKVLSFSGNPALNGARVKLLRAGLRLYASWHRQLVGPEGGKSYFELMPQPGELDEARRLAAKYGASAVVSGHTHSARWHAAEDIVFANTGSWIWLMRLPAPEAGDEVWADFLMELRQNPALDPAQQRHARLEQRFTYAIVEPADGTIRLTQWTEGAPRELGAAPLRPGP